MVPWGLKSINFCDSTFHGFFKDFVWERNSHHVCRSIVNNMSWVRKSQQFLQLSMRTRSKPVWPVWNWTDSSIFLDDWRIKECGGCEQSLLPLPDFSRKIKGDSAHRVSLRGRHKWKGERRRMGSEKNGGGLGRRGEKECLPAIQDPHLLISAFAGRWKILIVLFWQ